MSCVVTCVRDLGCLGGSRDRTSGVARAAAVNLRSDLPTLPPRENYMAYMRMVSYLMPEHGLALSDRDETGVAYWNDGVMAWN